MEETIGQYLLQIRFHSQLGQAFPVHAHLVKLRNPVDLDARTVFHGQDFSCCAFPEDSGHLQPVLFTKVGAESVCALSFQGVINFL